ncbi:unnamed protein product [Bemisia tabaci]|uniref:ALMS motif domain-containing protein n=1 Tax=Bemisia tabaci TaxID=7038 RepID=A0A9P0ABV1_BEMTA|nr:unnamed protein product [Bemisia tabaci]
MEQNKKRLSAKKETSRDARTPTNYSPSQFARPPTTGTSSSSSEDRSTSVKSSDDTSPEDIIKISPAPNSRAKETPYPSTSFKISRNPRDGLELKFDSAPSAYFTPMKCDLPVDITLSPQDGNRIPSPASISSLTSRPLEWDSGADVGYVALGVETGLSTIERIALAQGSAILLPRSDPEGTTETASKPVKIINPTIEKLIGTPAAESTTISSNMMSPISTSKPFYFQGVSPIISSSTHVVSKINSPVESGNNQMKQIEPQFSNLCLEDKNPPCDKVPSPSTPNPGMDGTESRPEGNCPKIEDAAVDKKENYAQVEPPKPQASSKASSAKEESTSQNSSNKIIANDAQLEHPLVLKKSASCSNLLQATQSVDLRFLKPLKRHFQNSASSSSISTVIDRSKKKSRKFFATSSLISEKSETKGKQFKSPRKILSPSKKLHQSSSKISHINSLPKTPQNENPPDVQKATTQNSQIAFHTSIQQSILDELQQCVNEISNNFNSSKNNHKNRGDSSQGHRKKGSGSTHGNCSTLESIASVQTNDSWNADFNAKESTTSAEKAKSFEYLPGDMYERNSSECFQAQKKTESSSSVSEKIDFSESSRDELWNPSSMNLFQLELDRGVNLLKNFIHNSTTFDSRRKQLLMKKIAKKLIDSEYNCLQKPPLNEHPAVSKKVGPSEVYLRDGFKFSRTNNKSSELSGSTQISQSYVESTSGSSCLNLVMRPLKKTTSVESSDNPNKISSGIRHIQENYCSNNRSFDLLDETKDEYVTNEAQHQNHARTGARMKEQENLKVLRDKTGRSSGEYSKSSSSTGNCQQVFYSSEYQWLSNMPSKNKFMRSPKYKKFSRFQNVDKKNDGESRLLNENSDGLPDGRTVNLGRNAYRPFPNSTNDSSTKGSLNCKSSYPQDWRKPTSDSERRYEEKLIFADKKANKKESALLYNYLDAERRNHLLWIQSEINHLSNLKALIEKQEKLKEGFKVLKTIKVDGRGDSQAKLKPVSCLKKSGTSSSAQTSYEGNDKNLKAPRQLEDNFSRSSSDKENKDLQNRTYKSANTTRTRSGGALINQSSKENSDNDLSSKHSHYISATSDVTNDTWAESSNKHYIKNRKKNYSTPPKAKRHSNSRKKPSKPISYTILFDPPKSARTPFHAPTPKIIKNTDNLASKAPEPTLQECLARKHPEIIKRVEFRKNCIAELACLRQLQNERKKQLVLACGSVDRATQVPSKDELPSLKEKRIFSQKKLRQQTEKKYRKCFEVTQKLKEQKTKEEYRTNRLMAETFAKRLQRKTLKGQVDLSNSVMVIES